MGALMGVRPSWSQAFLREPALGITPHPVCLTWEVMLDPGHEGDAMLGSGFKMVTELSGSGTEDDGEAGGFPEGPGTEGGHLQMRPHLAARVMRGIRGTRPPAPQPCELTAPHPPNQSHPRAEWGEMMLEPHV